MITYLPDFNEKNNTETKMGRKRELCYNAIVKQIPKTLKKGRYYIDDNGVIVIPYLCLSTAILRKINDLDYACCGKTESQYLKMRVLKEEHIIIKDLGYPKRMTHEELRWVHFKRKILERIDRPYTAAEISGLNKEDGAG